MKGSLIQTIKGMYPKGTRIELIHMADTQAPPSGTKGTVVCVDDMGTVHMKWDNGCGLGLIPEADEFKIIEEEN